MTKLRLLPVLLFALCCLLGLKAIDLMGRHGFGPAVAIAAEDPGPDEKAGEHDEASASPEAGSKDKKPDHAKDKGDGKPEDGKPEAGVVLQQSLIAPDSYSPAERELLSRLQQRRDQLDQRGQELDTREGLLKAAEKRVEDRIAELKRLEAALATQDAKRTDADTARLKGVVTMYEAMKAKDAARVFNGLDMTVLLSVVTAMKPQKVGDVLAAMEPAVAQRLTVAMATRQQTKVPDMRPALELPQIQGSPKG